MDRIQDQDERIKNHLNRKDRISHIIKNNLSNIEGSLKQIEEISLKGTNNANSYSPLKGSLRSKN